MAASRQTAPSIDAAEPLGGPLARLLHRLLGLAVLVGCGLAIAALATWSVGDPSLSNATPGTPRNLLGFGGASLADFLLQMIGLAAPVLFVPPIAWALRLLGARPARVTRRRLIAWPIAIVLLAGVLTVLVPPATWPLPTGLGGVIGDVVANVPRGVAMLLSLPPAILVGGVLGLPALAALVFATGYPAPKPPPRVRVPDPLSMRQPLRRGVAPAPSMDDEEEPDRLGLLETLVGYVGHWRLALSARLRRPPKRQDTEADRLADLESLGIDVRPGRAAERPARREPRFEADAAAAPPWDEPEPMDVVDDEEEAYRAARREFEDDEEEEIDDAPPPPVLRREVRPAQVQAPQPTTAGSRVTPPAPPPKQSKRDVREAQPSLLAAESPFELPPVRLLSEPKPQGKSPGLDTAALENNARMLEGVLEDFGVRGQIVNVRPGPVVTLYELEPAPGIKSSRVIGLADDIARSMSAISARVAVIPGKNAIGIELPNERRETVFLRQLIASVDFEQSKQRLALCLGKTIGGEPVIADLARMPHLLVAGTTGSGKSVAINTMILSVLYRLRPDQCRLIMIDPKMLELSVYDGIPHLLTPVVTDPKKAVVALKWTVREMEERYRKMSKLGVRNIDGFNARVAEAAAKGESLSRIVQTGFDRESGEPIFEEEEIGADPIPYIVVIVDEMADLMMVAGKDIEGAIQRLAQMARAAGIHIVMATQRPSVDVITGTIKANFPTRISFQVTSKIDSRTILGEQGAEQLLGQGDMLYMAGGGRIQRVHGPFVSDNEVEAVVAHLKRQGAPDYLDQITVDDDEDGGEGGGGYESLEESGDLYDRAVAVVLRDRKASTSYVQRRLQIGYNRAASLIERMEREGIVGQANHAGKRDILVGGDTEAA